MVSQILAVLIFLVMFALIITEKDRETHCNTRLRSAYDHFSIRYHNA
mgnify:CR=1 FL=1